MTLREQLDAFRAEWTAKAPEGRAALYQAKIDELRASGVLERALKPGVVAPAFELPDAGGTLVESAKLLATGPVIVTFYRGGWCPYCNLQLRAYQSVLTEIAKHGAQLVAISPQLPDGSLSTAKVNALSFYVLSDVGNVTARNFGLVYALPEELRQALSSVGKALTGINGDDTWQLPVPATFIIRRDGRVTFAHVDVDYRLRLEPQDLIASLAKLGAQ